MGVILLLLELDSGNLTAFAEVDELWLFFNLHAKARSPASISILSELLVLRIWSLPLSGGFGRFGSG